MQKIKESRFWEKRRAKHLLTGLVVCAACGGRYTTVGRDYLACGNARGRGTCRQRRGIRRPVVEKIVVDALRRDLMVANEVEAFLAGYQRQINQDRSLESAERQEAERALATLERKLEGLYDAIADGLRSPGLKEKLESMEVERDGLRRRLEKPAPSPIRLHASLAEHYRRKMEVLAQALRDPVHHDRSIELLRHAVERVAIREEPGCFVIAVDGAISAMVSLALGQAAGTERAVLDERTARSVKVVAGTGNHRESSLLQALI